MESADCPSSLPTLPGDVVDKILDLVKQSWRDRPRMLAKDEVSTCIIIESSDIVTDGAHAMGHDKGTSSTLAGMSPWWRLSDPMIW